MNDQPWLIDSHIHLDHFALDLAEGLLAFAQQNALSLWANSMDLESFLKTQALLYSYGKPAISKTRHWIGGEERTNQHLLGLGLHPMESAKGQRPTPQWIRTLEEADFIGEVGVDHHWVEDRSGDKNQIWVLEEILEIASDKKIMVQIHTKGAERLVVDLLEKYEPDRPLIHWYSGTEDLLPPLLELGCWFTIGPDLLKGSSLVVKAIPKNRVLLESDGPTGPPWITGKPWSNEVLGQMLSALSKEWSTQDSETQKILFQNARSLIPTMLR